MRVLVATTAGAGHWAGLLPFAQACVRAGHDLRVAAPASFAGAVEGAGLVHAAVADAEPDALGAVFGRIPSLTMHEADELVVQEVFGRLNRDAALPAMRAVAADWRPDVILREPGEISSYIVATEYGIPHVQVNIGLSALDDRLVPLLSVPVEEVGVTSAGLLAAPRWTTVPPSFDVAATLVDGAVTRARELGPGPGTSPPLPDWWSGDADEPLVYVTFGSVAASIGLFPDFYTRVLEQLAEVPARILLTLGETGDPDVLGPLPSHVHVERWWRQADVLAHAAVVVGHGGFGTTQAALCAAVPQVVLPLFSSDQFLNAERVAAVGAGVQIVDEGAGDRRAGDIVPLGPAATDRLGAAVLAVVGGAHYAACARSLAAEIDALPDVDECVTSLLALRR